MSIKLLFSIVVFIPCITVYCQDFESVCCRESFELMLPNDFEYIRDDIDDYGNSFILYSYFGNNDSLFNSRVSVICCHNCDLNSLLCETDEYEQLDDILFFKCGSNYRCMLKLNSSCFIFYEFPIEAIGVFSSLIKKQLRDDPCK